jgi:hypothetical protein
MIAGSDKCLGVSEIGRLGFFSFWILILTSTHIEACSLALAVATRDLTANTKQVKVNYYGNDVSVTGCPYSRFSWRISSSRDFDFF